MTPDPEPRVLLVSPHLAPPAGGIERLAEDIFRSRPPGQLFCVGVSTEARVESNLETIVGRRGRTEALSALRLTARVFRLAREFRPQVVHALTWRAGLTAMIALPRTPLVVHCHAAELRRPNDRLSRLLRRQVLGRAAEIVAVSRYTAGVAATLCDRQPVVIPPAIRSMPERLSRSGRGCTRVLSVGRLVPHKGHALLIRLIGQLIGEGSAVQLTIVGKGPERHQLERLVTELGLRDRVTLAGSVSDDTLAEFYRDADVFALLSRETDLEVEGFGIVFLEASSWGLPIIAGRSGGAEDAVVEGTTGFLVTQEAEAATALRALINDAALRQQMGDAGRDFAKGFSRDRLGARLQAVYAAVL